MDIVEIKKDISPFYLEIYFPIGLQVGHYNNYMLKLHKIRGSFLVKQSDLQYKELKKKYGDSPKYIEPVEKMGPSDISKDQQQLADAACLKIETQREGMQ